MLPPPDSRASPPRPAAGCDRSRLARMATKWPQDPRRATIFRASERLAKGWMRHGFQSPSTLRRNNLSSYNHSFADIRRGDFNVAPQRHNPAREEVGHAFYRHFLHARRDIFSAPPGFADYPTGPRPEAELILFNRGCH